MSQYAGSNWIKRSLMVKKMSPLGEAVADLLGDVFFGIYHLDSAALRRVEWDNTHHVTFNLRWRSLATVDYNELTLLVVLAHDRNIRVSIEAVAPHTLHLIFHQRERGTMHEQMSKCPSLEDHIAAIREHYKTAEE